LAPTLAIKEHCLELGYFPVKEVDIGVVMTNNFFNFMSGI
jgi:hypothetical protein